MKKFLPYIYVVAFLGCFGVLVFDLMKDDSNSSSQAGNEDHTLSSLGGKTKRAGEEVSSKSSNIGLNKGNLLEKSFVNEEKTSTSDWTAERNSLKGNFEKRAAKEEVSQSAELAERHARRLAKAQARQREAIQARIAEVGEGEEADILRHFLEIQESYENGTITPDELRSEMEMVRIKLEEQRKMKKGSNL